MSLSLILFDHHTTTQLFSSYDFDIGKIKLQIVLDLGRGMPYMHYASSNASRVIVSNMQSENSSLIVPLTEHLPNLC